MYTGVVLVDWNDASSQIKTQKQGISQPNASQKSIIGSRWSRALWLENKITS